MTQAAEYLRGESQLPVQSLDLDEADRLRVYQFQDGSIPIVTSCDGLSVPPGRITLIEIEEVAYGHGTEEMVDMVRAGELVTDPEWLREASRRSNAGSAVPVRAKPCRVSTAAKLKFKTSQG